MDETADPSHNTFIDVDASPEAVALVYALDEIAQVPAVQRLKAVAFGMLAPQPGQRLVDVGCGTGEDVRALAEAVGQTGHVTGIDPSDVMIQEAGRRTGDANLPIEFRRGDATALDLEAASVDGVRSERVFQHLADPEAAMAEFVRVVKPGGRIVVIDTDWGMHAVQGADPALTARILAAWSDANANGWSGRRLSGLFVAAGLSEPEIATDTFVDTSADRPKGPPITIVAAAAVRAGVVSDSEAADWLAQLVAAGREGQFLWAATMFAVAGRR